MIVANAAGLMTGLSLAYFPLCGVVVRRSIDHACLCAPSFAASTPCLTKNMRHSMFVWIIRSSATPNGLITGFPPAGENDGLGRQW